MMQEDEALSIFVDDQREILEYEFINKLPIEDQPLDDDHDECIENRSDEFDAYCREQLYKES